MFTWQGEGELVGLIQQPDGVSGEVVVQHLRPPHHAVCELTSAHHGRSLEIHAGLMEDSVAVRSVEVLGLKAYYLPPSTCTDLT